MPWGKGGPPKEKQVLLPEKVGKELDRWKQQTAPTPPHGMECMKTRLYTWQVLKIAAMTSLTQFVNVS